MGKIRKISSAQKGHVTKADIERMKKAEDIINGRSDNLSADNPPAQLSDGQAVETWKRLIPELLDIAVIGNIDEDALVAYCNAWSKYLQGEESLKGQPLVLTKETKYGPVKYRNPNFDVVAQASAEVRKWATRAGIDINTRLKAGMAKVQKKESDIAEQFGAI